MTMLPLVLWLHVDAPDHRPVRLWLPLFLVWLLLLPLALLAVICTMLADAILFLVGVRYHRYTSLLLGCIRLLADTRGTVVRVRGPHTIVDMTLV